MYLVLSDNIWHLTPTLYTRIKSEAFAGETGWIQFSLLALTDINLPGYVGCHY